MQLKVHQFAQDFFDFFGEKHQFYSLPNHAETGYYGTFDKNKAGLQRDNEAGKDIYFTVNEAKAGIQRTKDRFVRARAVYIDDDGDEKHGGHTGGFPIPPNLTVCTSSGKYHYYWFTTTEDGELLEAVLRGMAKKFNGDPAATDRLRILRAPGFIHNKSGDVVTFEAHHDHIYDWNEITDAFPPDLTAPALKNKEVSDVKSYSTQEAVEGILMGEEIHINRVSLAMHYHNMGIPRDEIIETLITLVNTGVTMGNIDPERARERIANMPQAVDTAIAKRAAEQYVPKFVHEGKGALFTKIPDPVGGMKVIIEDVVGMMRYPDLNLATAIAFHTMSTFGGGIYHLDGRTVARKRTVLAGTGRGKAFLNDYFTAAMTQMVRYKGDFNPYVFAGTPSYAVNNMHVELREHRVRSYIITEAGQQSKSQAGTVTETRAYILDLTAASYYTAFKGKQYSVKTAENKKTNELLTYNYGSILVSLNESVPEPYMESQKSGDGFSSGDVGREEIYWLDKIRGRRNRNNRHEVNDKVVRAYYHLAKEFHATGTQSADNVDNTKVFKEVDWSRVENLLIDYGDVADDRYDERESGDHVAEAVVSRLYEKILTTCLVQAIAEAGFKAKKGKIPLPIVTDEHFHYAVKLQEALCESLLAQNQGEGMMADPTEQCFERLYQRATSFGDRAKDRDCLGWKDGVCTRGWITGVLDRANFKPMNKLIMEQYFGKQKQATDSIIQLCEDRGLIKQLSTTGKTKLWKINL